MNVGAGQVFVNRSEHLRVLADRQRDWPQARYTLVQLGEPPLFDIAADGLVWRQGGGPFPADGIYLGQIDGTDSWAIPGSLANGSSLRSLGTQLGALDTAQATTAQALVGWHHNNPYCARCGAPTRATHLGWQRDCPAGHQFFPRTDPSVIVLITDGADQVLLARNCTWPTGRFSVLAGFVEAGESLAEAVHREIGEEVGLPVRQLVYLGSQPWPFPQSLMVAFRVCADPDLPIRCAPGEIAEARWVNRGAVRAALAGQTGDFSLPSAVSIAYRMLADWAD